MMEEMTLSEAIRRLRVGMEEREEPMDESTRRHIIDTIDTLGEHAEDLSPYEPVEEILLDFLYKAFEEVLGEEME